MRRIVLFACTAITALGCGPERDDSHCGPAEAVVAEVIDGDTIVLENGDRVRYLMVDTPEVTQGKNECWGNEARSFNASLVLGQIVSLRYDAECKDRYGRWLAYVSVGGREVNELLLERGHACVLHIAPNGCDRLDDYLSLEEDARSSGLGLWGGACEAPPCRTSVQFARCG